VPVTTEDAGSVLFRFDDGSKGCLACRRSAPGEKPPDFEINGSDCSLAWDQETAAAVDWPASSG
jgi:predicted dehydrogenase